MFDMLKSVSHLVVDYLTLRDHLGFPMLIEYGLEMLFVSPHLGGISSLALPNFPTKLLMT